MPRREKAAARLPQSKRRQSAAEAGEEPEEERECNAEEEASDDGKVERGVLAAVDDVAGEAAQAEGELVTEVKKSAKKNEESSEEEKRAAEFAERVHEVNCSGGGGGKGIQGRKEKAGRPD